MQRFQSTQDHGVLLNPGRRPKQFPGACNILLELTADGYGLASELASVVTARQFSQPVSENVYVEVDTNDRERYLVGLVQALDWNCYSAELPNSNYIQT